jgi:hypothetical protein
MAYTGHCQQCLYQDLMLRATFKHSLVFIQSVQHFRPILTTFGSRGQILIKVSNIKFQEKPSNGSQADKCGWTDRHAKANRHFPLLMQTRLK